MDNNKNLFGLVLILVLGLFISFTDVKTKKTQEISPDELYQKVIQKTRYFSPEQVAEKIISGDPALMLIDVRNAEFYNKFTLKGAMNIPLKDILKKENIEYFDQDVYDIVLFSNGSSDADAAWLLVTRLGFKNVYVMQGGLNAWVSRILQPKQHSVIWDRIDDEMYQYRRGASEYFGGKSSAPADDATSAPKPKKAIKRHKKKEVEGGCG